MNILAMKEQLDSCRNALAVIERRAVNNHLLMSCTGEISDVLNLKMIIEQAKSAMRDIEKWSIEATAAAVEVEKLIEQSGT